ncbi:hypothetical protein D7V83_17655 [bacterium 0.1xD8-71]|nr:hypothetical protein D7V83_17655 [bacterium 0.1xD8-71]
MNPTRNLIKRQNRIEEQGLCNVYKNNPCFFVYRVKNTMWWLTDNKGENIMVIWNAFHNKMNDIFDD